MLTHQGRLYDLANQPISSTLDVVFALYDSPMGGVPIWSEVHSVTFDSVAIDDKHPLRVFIQLEDDENIVGVVVKNKTAHGFDVVERLGGKSSATFQWQIVANRADEILPSGRLSRNADARF